MNTFVPIKTADTDYRWYSGVSHFSALPYTLSQVIYDFLPNRHTQGANTFCRYASEKDALSRMRRTSGGSGCTP
jgi:hypothetical protein